MSLTAGEIAQRIRRPATDPKKTIERIKHWTSLHLLQPLEGHRGGTGHHYSYDESALIEISILSAIADSGMPILKVGRNLLYGLARARSAFDEWEKAGRKGDYFFEIAFERRNPPIVEVHQGSVRSYVAAEVSLILNLHQVFSRLPSGLAQEEEIAVRIEARLANRKSKKVRRRSRSRKR